MKLRKLLNQKRSRSLKASRRLAFAALLVGFTSSVANAQGPQQRTQIQAPKPAVEQRLVGMLGFSNRPVKIQRTQAQPLPRTRSQGDAAVRFASHNGAPANAGVQPAVAMQPQGQGVQLAIATSDGTNSGPAPVVTSQLSNQPATLLNIDIPIPGVPGSSPQVEPCQSEPCQNEPCEPATCPSETAEHEMTIAESDNSDAIRISFSEDSVETSFSDNDMPELPGLPAENSAVDTPANPELPELPAVATVEIEESATLMPTVAKSSGSGDTGPVKVTISPAGSMPSPSDLTDTQPSIEIVQSDPLQIPETSSGAVEMSLSSELIAEEQETLDVVTELRPVEPLPAAQPEPIIPLPATQQLVLETEQDRTPPAIPSPTEEAPKGMRVQIEGEPAMVVSRDQAHEVTTPEVPQPTFEAPSYELLSEPREQEPVVSSYAMEPNRVPETQKRTVPAKLASRVVAVTNSAPEESPALSQSKMSNGKAVKVAYQESMALTTKQVIAEYSVEHPAICKLIKTGDQSLSLIGLQSGETRIALVTFDEEGQRNVELRQVQVSVNGAGQVNVRGLASEVAQTVSRMFPRSEIQVIPQGDAFIVQGIVESEKDARKIISFVRKTTLSPVVDKIQSYGR